MNTFALCSTLLSIYCIISIDSDLILGGRKPITDEKELEHLSKTIGVYLGKMNQQGGAIRLEMIRLYSATKQLVSGFNYDVNAEINENNTPADCHISLWETFSNFVRMNVECGKEKREYNYASHMIWVIVGWESNSLKNQILV